MDITICAAISIDGKIADKNNGVDWISQEDQIHLKKMIKDHDVLVMGRTTFENYKKQIDPSYNKLRIILTKKPDKYTAEIISGKIEFSDISGKLLIAQLQKRDYKKILILGGSTVFSDFLNNDLYDDIYITVEPIFLGSGTPFTISFDHQIKNTLKKSTILNKKGTLLLHYIKK